MKVKDCSFLLLFVCNIVAFHYKAFRKAIYIYIEMYESDSFNYKICTLTLTLVEPKVINFCHQYRARPPCTWQWLISFGSSRIKVNVNYMVLIDILSC